MTDLRVDTTLLTTDAGRELVVTVTPDDDDATMGDTRITGLLLADDDDDEEEDEDVDDVTVEDDDDDETAAAAVDDDADVVEAVEERAVRVFSWLIAVETRAWPQVTAKVVRAEGPFTATVNSSTLHTTQQKTCINPLGPRSHR